MSTFFAGIGAITLLAALVGLFVPKTLLPWIPVEKRTRVKAFGLYFLLTMLFGGISTATMTPEEKQEALVQEEQQKASREAAKAQKLQDQALAAQEKARQEAAALQASQISAMTLWQAYDNSPVDREINICHHIMQDINGQ